MDDYAISSPDIYILRLIEIQVLLISPPGVAGAFERVNQSNLVVLFPGKKELVRDRVPLDPSCAIPINNSYPI